MFPTKKLQYFEERLTRHIDGYFHKLRHISPPAYYRHNKLDIPLHFRIYPIAPTPPRHYKPERIPIPHKTARDLPHAIPQTYHNPYPKNLRINRR